jgi:transcriptional regulator with XRE-family HTH domain
MLANNPAPQDHEAWAEALGHTIKVLRTDLGIGRRRLATASGISYSYLSAIENGNKVPSNKILRVIAKRLELQPHELYAAAEARLARGQRPADATIDKDAAIIEAQERRFLERQAARLGIGASPQADELHRLIDSLEPADVALILETARRLAR